MGESRRRTEGSGGEEGDFEQGVDEQTRRRRALDAKLDAIGKTGGKRRPKKRGEDVSPMSSAFLPSRMSLTKGTLASRTFLGRRFTAGQASRGYHRTDEDRHPGRHLPERAEKARYQQDGTLAQSHAGHAKVGRSGTDLSRRSPAKTQACCCLALLCKTRCWRIANSCRSLPDSSNLSRMGHYLH